MEKAMFVALWPARLYSHWGHPQLNYTGVRGLTLRNWGGRLKTKLNQYSEIPVRITNRCKQNSAVSTRFDRQRVLRPINRRMVSPTKVGTFNARSVATTGKSWYIYTRGSRSVNWQSSASSRHDTTAPTAQHSSPACHQDTSLQNEHDHGQINSAWSRLTMVASASCIVTASICAYRQQQSAVPVVWTRRRVLTWKWFEVTLLCDI